MNEQQTQEQVRGSSPGDAEHPISTMLRMGPSSAEVDNDALQGVRRFHLGGPIGEHALPEGMTPALLWPFRHAQVVRSDYPLVLPPIGPDARAHLPIADALNRAFAGAFDDKSSVRLLADNLTRLERYIRLEMAESDGVASFHGVFDRAAVRLRAKLRLSEAYDAELERTLCSLAEGVPSGSRLLDFRASSDLWLLVDAVQTHHSGRHAGLVDEARVLTMRLKSLLSIDDLKSAKAHEPDILAHSLGGVGFIDPSRLSAVLGQHRGTQVLSVARRKRIEATVASLHQLIEGKLPRVVILHRGVLPELRDAGVGVRSQEVADPLESAAMVFDECALTFAGLFRAMRIARLDVEAGDGKYESSYHDAWFESFDWSAFSHQEAQLLPAIVVVENATDLCGHRLGALSELIRSGRRVTVVARVQPALNPGGEGARVSASHRLELGYVGISHQEVFVHQGAAVRPAQLYAGFLKSLSTSHPSLHIIATADMLGPAYGAVGPWLFSGAAVESRAHPLFLYNPEAGETWARRVDFSGNPEPDGDFPSYPLSFVDANGIPSSKQSTFSFADFSLLASEYKDHFCVVPRSCEHSECFVELDEYLRLNQESSIRALPFVWGADGDGLLHRLALSREMVFACRDRLSFWRTLQELAGVRNEHVESAVARAIALERDAAAKQRSLLEERHLLALEDVRSRTASDALGRLARALVSSDVLALGIPEASLNDEGANELGPLRSVNVADLEPVVDQQAEPVAVAPEVATVGEPWLDSGLCTSCNDCVSINSRMFSYNANKQAELVDPSAGTYSQLVNAAERCPARCIHPGRPLNPSEPNLQELVARALQFG